MSWAAAIVMIVMIGAAASVLRSRNNARNGITEDMMGNQTITHRPDPTPQADEEAQRVIAELKERIALLERIAYDKNTSTARERERISAEIDALRDSQD